MNVQAISRSAEPFRGVNLPALLLDGIESVVLRHLKTESEIASFLHLRDEIDLSAVSSADANFLRLEKKETSAGSCSGSS